MSQWVKHDGGECPVGSGALVDVVYGDGEGDDKLAASEIDWRWVIKYRLYCPLFDSGWIKADGNGIPEKAKNRVVELKGKDGDRMHAEDTTHSWDSIWNELVGWYRLPDTDPRKEWVKIEPGCPMPEDLDKVHIICDGCQHYGVKWHADLCVWRDSGMVWEHFEATHWRYPHPDPEAE